ncbi:hypothetical protein [Burkholderia sp. Se-20378]|uniref:hypothetical protein n=1 Tax=Burkholderia sp. Se-20378 TaxID=2703899 RepID=UPI00197CBF1C|nr:hypothetical protein [Burkholderia sp. Se-20378]MBN3770710.1 hypothetical protein [Burkholderia sp. Se-20378]
MLVVDPYLFLPSATNGTYDAQRLAEIKSHLSEIISICKKNDWKIYFDRGAWKSIEQSLIRKLTSQHVSDHALSVAFSVLRSTLKLIEPTATGTVRTYGVKPMYALQTKEDDARFAEGIAKSLLHTLQNYGRAYLFVRELTGRNINILAAGKSFITERTRWRLYISATGFRGAIAVPCITTARNVSIEWTTRYDCALPDSGSFTFYPPDEWYLRATKAVATMSSKPVFLDRKENGWAKPDTNGTPYHWDVFINDQKWLKKIGINPINVCRHGIPDSQGTQGEIHHIPENKKARAKG